MKKLVLLFSAFTVFSLRAQETNDWLLDSLNYESEFLSTYYAYDYDDQARLTERRRPTTRYSIEYGDMQEVRTEERKIGDVWQLDRRLTYTYNGDNLELFLIEDYVDGQWQNDRKEEYFYNAENLDTLLLVSAWNASSWEAISKREKTYDMAANELSSYSYLWQVMDQSYVFDRGNSYAYDENNNQIEDLFYLSGDEGEMLLEERVERSYDLISNMLDTVWIYSDYTTGEAAVVNRNTYTYTDETVTTLREKSLFGEEWEWRSMNVVHINNEHLFVKRDSLHDYTISPMQTEPNARIIYTEEEYDTDRYLTTQTRFDYGLSEEAWALSYITERWYFHPRFVDAQEVSVQANAQLFPNPISIGGLLSVSMDQVISGEIEIYCTDMNGRLVGFMASDSVKGLQLNAPQQAGLYAVSILVDGVLFKTVKLMVTE